MPREVGDRPVAAGEVVGDVEAEQHGEIEAAVRDVGRGRPAARMGPVDDTGDPAVLPQHVPGMEVAVAQHGVRTGARAGVAIANGPPPHVGPS